MREKIVFAPGLNGSELMASLARHGVNSFNLRIFSAVELAHVALMRSGIPVTENFIDSKEEKAIIAEAVKGVSYFGKTSYADIQAICNVIRMMRCLVTASDEAEFLCKTLSKGLFQEKNNALIKVYQNYMKALSLNKAIDTTGLIRKAANECSPLDADFIVLKEFPLNPLQKALLDKVSSGNSKNLSLCDLFKVSDKPISIESCKNCYGASNEVEAIISDIYREKCLDGCTVAVTNVSTYGQLFFDYALLYDIPITFGCGISIINSNPARLLKLYYYWFTKGFFGANAISDMIKSPAFNRSKLREMFPELDVNFNLDKFCEILGGLRLTNNAAENQKRIAGYKKAVEKELLLMTDKDEEKINEKKKYIPCLEIMAKELALPAYEFISTFAHIRRGNESNAQRLLMMLDISASKAIHEELQAIQVLDIDQPIDDIIMNVLKTTVCKQRSEAGKLHIAELGGAIATIRDNLYIAGLSASMFPGSPKENYLLLDADLKLFGEAGEYLTADGQIRRKEEQLFELARLSSSLGAKLYLSYAGHNVVDLKKDNRSSLIFKLYREANAENGTSKDIEKYITDVTYFEPEISMTRYIGDAYNKDKDITINSVAERNMMNIPLGMELQYSPTALKTFFDCPRKFMFQHLLHIPEPEEYNPLKIISELDKGNLAHALMEHLANSSLSKNEFLRLSGEYFDCFVAEHPPLMVENVAMERKSFLEMMESAYDQDPHREVILKEEKISCTHEGGVKINGFPDRVEKLDDGSYWIVDFKTGKTLEHKENDIETCLQVVLYAYLMEQKGYKISGGEYRYLKLGDTVSCKYNEEIRARLSEKLQYFKECLMSGNFPLVEVPEDKPPCKYCKYKEICGKQEN